MFMDRTLEEHLYNGIPFYNKKEWTTDTYNNEFLSELLQYYTELKKPESSLLYLYEIQQQAELIFGYRNLTSGWLCNGEWRDWLKMDAFI